MKNAALNAPHTAELPNGNVTAGGKKQGIYVCGSDEERKPFPQVVTIEDRAALME